MPLFVAVVASSIVIWLVLIISVVGLIYAALIGLFFFVSHLVFVSHLRGSGVRLGPDQFPELHRRIGDLAAAMEMEPPEAYLLQADGALNALATRFLGRDIVVLYSDLLAACEDNERARDMIIAHELAHLRCGHLRWHWLTLPGAFVPFLGSALSRAREYTCDRFGLEGSGDPAAATLGLAILSAGPRFGPAINLRAFVNQRSDVNTGMMTLGEWLSSHPPLAKRIAILHPSLADGRFHPGRGRALAGGIVAAALVVVAVGTVAAVRVGSGVMNAVNATTSGGATPDQLRAQAEADISRLSAFVDEEWGLESPPSTIDEIFARWRAVTNEVFPIDPFDGYPYGYESLPNGYRFWSLGPDATSPRDDVVLETTRP
ncbi:MAG: M48 family metallopeptidase [Dehalococcoidia bacterium]